MFYSSFAGDDEPDPIVSSFFFAEASRGSEWKRCVATVFVVQKPSQQFS